MSRKPITNPTQALEFLEGLSLYDGSTSSVDAQDSLDEVVALLKASGNGPAQGVGVECCERGRAEGCLVCADCEHLSMLAANLPQLPAPDPATFPFHSLPQIYEYGRACVRAYAARLTSPNDQECKKP